jgi:hypothetical protein
MLLIHSFTRARRIPFQHNDPHSNHLPLPPSSPKHLHTLIRPRPIIFGNKQQPQAVVKTMEAFSGYVITKTIGH